MTTNNSQPSKKFSVTLSENVSQIPTYDLFLIKGTEDLMEIQLANRIETDTELKVIVESVFRIPKEAIPNFARQFSNYLKEYVDRLESQD